MKTVNSKLLLVLVVATVGLWGCSQSGNDARSAAAKIRHLEYRNAKLEEDYRASVAEVSILRKKIAAQVKQTEDLNRQQQQLQNLIKEREELQEKLAQSEGDRDSLRVQLNSFGKELQDLVGRVQQVSSTLPNSGLVTTVSQQN